MESRQALQSAASATSQAAGAVALVGSLALMTTNPGAAFVVSSVISTFTLLSLLNGPKLILLDATFQSLMSVKLIDLKLQRSFDETVETQEAADPSQISETAASVGVGVSIFLNYGEDLVWLGCVLSIGLLLLVLHVIVRRLSVTKIQQTSQLESTNLPHSQDPELARSQGQDSDGIPKNEDSTDHSEFAENSTGKGGILLRVTGYLVSTFGPVCFFAETEASAVELFTYVCAQLMFVPSAVTVHRVGVVLAVAVLLYYAVFAFLLSRLGLAVRRRLTEAQVAAGYGPDEEPPEPDTDDQSQTHRLLSEQISLETVPLPLLHFVYEAHKADPSTVAVWSPLIGLSRSFVSAAVVLGLARSGVSQVVVLLVVQSVYVCGVVRWRVKSDAVDHWMDVLMETWSLGYIVGRLASWRETGEEERQQMGGVLAWVVMAKVYAAVGYVFLKSIQQLWQICSCKNKEPSNSKSEHNTTNTSQVKPKSTPSNRNHMPSNSEHTISRTGLIEPSKLGGMSHNSDPEIPDNRGPQFEQKSQLQGLFTKNRLSNEGSKETW